MFTPVCEYRTYPVAKAASVLIPPRELSIVPPEQYIGVAYMCTDDHILNSSIAETPITLGAELGDATIQRLDVFVIELLDEINCVVGL